LRANEGLDHRQSILPINRQRNKGDGYFDNSLTMRAASPTRQIGSKLLDRAESQAGGPSSSVRPRQFKWPLVFR
jgi:hypothetical protein